MKKWTDRVATGGQSGQEGRAQSAKTRTVKVVAAVCALSLLTVVAGASIGVVTPVAPAAADEITPAPGVTISPIPLPTPTGGVPSIPSIPSLPSGGLPSDLPTSLPSGLPTALPPIKTPDLTPKPPADEPFTETDLNIDVGKSLTIETDATGQIQSNAFNVSTNVSGDGAGTVTVPVGPNRARDVTSFSPLTVEDESIIYDIDNQMPTVENKIASMGQYGGKMPISLKTTITQNGQTVDPNTAKALTGAIEVQWEFKNHTTSTQSISYRGPGGETVTEQAAISVPFGVGLSATFGSGWADVAAPWANTGFAVGQVLAGAVQLKDSSVIAKVTGVADNAKLPELKVKATPKDSTSATSGLYSKGAEIGAEVDDFLSQKGVPLLVKVQGALGQASTGVAAFLDDKVNPILEMTAKLRVNPKQADAKINDTVNQVTQATDALFMLNGVSAGATGEVAQYVAAATSPASQKKIEGLIGEINGAEDLLDDVIKQVKAINDELPALIDGLTTPLKGTEQLVCPGGSGPCDGADVIEGRVIALLPSTCTSGDATRTYLNNNAVEVAAALEAGKAALKGDDKKNLADLQDLLNAQAAGVWDLAACTSGAEGVKKAAPVLISDLPEINEDIGLLLPLLNDVEDGLKVAVRSLTKFAAAMPEINYALDHDCSPKVISNISECGLVQAMQIASDTDKRTAQQVRRGLELIVKDLQVPLNQIFAVANDIGRGSLPLEKTLNDLPGVINELGNGPFGEFTAEVENLAGLASSLTTSASKTVAINNAVDQKFHSGEAFPYGSATGANATTSATYAFTVSAPGASASPIGAIAAFAGVLLLIMLSLAVWLSRRPNAV